jgi:hypothetical protein
MYPGVGHASCISAGVLATPVLNNVIITEHGIRVVIKLKSSISIIIYSVATYRDGKAQDK